MDGKKILVAIDFDSTSQRAVEEAIRLAVALGAGIELAHVEPLPPAAPSELIGRRQADLVDLDAARKELAAIAAPVEALGIAVGTHLAVGSVVFGLMDLIDHVKPTMVVLGTHGRGVIKRALMGSVAESIVRRSPVPVVVVPPAWRAQLAAHAAWACRDCGHMLGVGDSRDRCNACGNSPARWISAPVTAEPIDINEPAVGEVDGESLSPSRTNDPAVLFPTAPAGVEGYDINPELKVRY
jgi:nucleotide-binding universal stress UspA family protein